MAPLQEVVHGLAIECREESSGTPSLLLDISRADIDRAISRTLGRHKRYPGFDIDSNHDDRKLVRLVTLEEIGC